MRIVFMGTPDFAVPTLDALVAAGHAIVAVYTQPPRPGGRRGREPVASPVQRRAEALGIPVRTPAKLRAPEEQTAFAALEADVGVVAAYGLILPQAVLDAPRLGCLNVHGSLLPRWRGAAPVQRAILAGDAETGVGIMQMEAGLDTGPVRLEARTGVAGKTAGALTEELARLGAAAMVEVLRDIAAYPPIAQAEDGVTYAAKIDKAEARLDFAQAAEVVERQVRGFDPAPGAFFEFVGERVKVLAGDVVAMLDMPSVLLSSSPADAGVQSERLFGKSTIVPQLGPGLRRGGSGEDGVRETTGTVLDDRLTIACATGAFRPTRVQRAGRGVTSAAELLRGFPIPAGTRL